MIAARQIAFGRGGKRKPYDAEVEYLQSTGTQYIDTGYILNTRSKLVLDVMWTAITNTTETAQQIGVVKWNDSGNYRTIFAQQMGTIAAFCADANPEFSSSTYDVYTYTADLPNKKCSISRSSSSRSANINTSLSGTFTKSFYIFAINNGGVAEHYCRCKIYSFKAYDNGSLVLDLVPVRKGDVGYMYDRVSGQLFGNQGTGGFILGNDIIDSPAREYVQDGLVAMWDGIENAGWGTHDANATVWKDLVGTRDVPMTNVSWGNDECIFDGVNSYGELYRGQISNMITCEVCFRSYKPTSFQMLVGNVPAGVLSLTSIGVVLGYNDYNTLDARKNVFNCVDTISRQSFSAGCSGDGTLAIGAVQQTPLPNKDCTGCKPSYLFIGCRRGISSAHEGLLDGAISSIRIYNRALTADEIAHNYNIDKARFGL